MLRASISVHCHPPHVAPFWQVIADCVMLCDPVIPDGERIVTPLQAHLELGFLYLLEKELQKIVTRPLMHIHNMASEGLVNIEVLCIAHGVSLYHFVNCRPHIGQSPINRRYATLAKIVVTKGSHIVNGVEPLQV